MAGPPPTYMMPPDGIVYSSVSMMDDGYPNVHILTDSEANSTSMAMGPSLPPLPIAVVPKMPAPSRRSAHLDEYHDKRKTLMAHRRHKGVAWAVVWASFNCWWLQNVLHWLEITQYYVPFVWIMFFAWSISLELGKRCDRLKRELADLDAALNDTEAAYGAVPHPIIKDV